MSLIKRNPNNFFPSFENVFDSFFNDESFFNSSSKGLSLPAVNVTEDDGNFGLEIVAPGKKKEDFTIEIKNDLLTISAEEKNESEEKEKNYTRKEFSYSSFSRSFRLPENVKTEDVSAEYNEGILKIAIPKKELLISKAKTIEVS